MKQNLTLNLESDLIKRAKILAAKKDVSLTQLIRDGLMNLLRSEGEYEKMRKNALGHLKKGASLGGGPYYQDRGKLHGR